jgi:excisionase family DNA binding protein
MSRLLSVEEVASLLNVPRKWVYRRVGLKPPEGIPYLKVGKYLRFRESDLRDYVERLRRN